MVAIKWRTRTRHFIYAKLSGAPGICLPCLPYRYATAVDLFIYMSIHSSICSFFLLHMPACLLAFPGNLVFCLIKCLQCSMTACEGMPTGIDWSVPDKCPLWPSDCSRCHSPHYPSSPTPVWHTAGGQAAAQEHPLPVSSTALPSAASWAGWWGSWHGWW